MRRFLEFKGQSFRLDYDRDGADFVIKTEPHPFLLNLQRAIGVGGSWRTLDTRRPSAGGRRTFDVFAK